MTHKTILIAATALLCSTAALAKDIKEMAVKTSPSVETVEQGQALQVSHPKGHVKDGLQDLCGQRRR